MNPIPRDRLIEGGPAFADAEIQQAWSEEIARRLKEIDEGAAELIPAQRVLGEARERIRAIRRAALPHGSPKSPKDEPG